MDKHLPGLDPKLTEAIIDTLREPVIILDGDLRVVAANRAYYDMFRKKHEDIHSKQFYELEEGGWDVPPLRVLLEQIISQKTTIEGYEVQHDFTTIGPRIMNIYARPIQFDAREENILVSIADVTEQRTTQRERELDASKRHAPQGDASPYRQQSAIDRERHLAQGR